MANGVPLLRVDRLAVAVRGRRGRSATILGDASATIHEGEILAVVGLSGSGKSTLLKAILGLVPFTGGTVTFRGETIRRPLDRAHGRLRGAAEAVFQNPLAALNPHRSLRHAIEEPLKARRVQRAPARVRGEAVAARMGLKGDILDRKPTAVSLGQAQRASIARALAPRPDLLFLDEPLSALDALIAVEVADLLVETIRDTAPTVLLVSHDLRLVRRLATRVLVVDAGKLVEDAPTTTFLAAPTSTVGRELVACDRRRRALFDQAGQSGARAHEAIL